MVGIIGYRSISTEDLTEIFTKSHEVLILQSDTLEIERDTIEKEIHYSINSERQKLGLSQLGWNKELVNIARKHSGDMASRSYFSHLTPEGFDLTFRYQKENFGCKLYLKNGLISGGGENIANVEHWQSQEDLAESIVDSWMISPSHRKNIETPYYETEGIGIATSKNSTIYVTQNFC